MPVRDIDRTWSRVRQGDRSAFAEWLKLTEIPLRMCLRRFARAVDVEEVMQEGLLRLWVLAPDRDLKGDNASLRYAVTVMVNLAKKTARRNGLLETIGIDAKGVNPSVDPEPPSDPGLARIIVLCFENLPPRPRQVIEALVEAGFALPHEELARRNGMKRNTFIQNLVRGRKAIRECLRNNGVDFHFLET
jgi:RNA polymerase sigma factor (sigma-70 family)